MAYSITLTDDEAAIFADIYALLAAMVAPYLGLIVAHDAPLERWRQKETRG